MAFARVEVRVLAAREVNVRGVMNGNGFGERTLPGKETEVDQFMDSGTLGTGL